VKRVIVVEDEPDIRRVIAEALGDEGYDVACAADGAQALRLVRRSPADVAIVDLMMPELDGRGFLRECRADPRFASMQFVVITAISASRLKGLEPDVTVLTKPFDLNDLVATVATLAAA
jgi:DNA-binding response OmpR family regulator